MPHLHIIFASTSGHTEYVVDVFEKYLAEHARQVQVTKKRVELASEQDLHQGDILLLASSTWNTGGREGQLNPHMHMYLTKHVATTDLGGKPTALIGLGDERYRYTANALKHLQSYVESHRGFLFVEPLRVVNEPYGQEEKVHEWAEVFLRNLSSRP